MEFDGISGLEAEFIYNGLRLNQRLSTVTNYTRYKITDIGGFDDAEVRDARELNPARDGELALPAYYGGRTITLAGKIIARNIAELREMQQALRTAFASLSESWMIVRNEPDGSRDLQIAVRKSGPVQMREIQNGQYPTRDFLITLRASDPRFYSSATNTVTRSGLAALTTFHVFNSGNANSDPLIQITGPFVPTVSGTGQVFALANITSGQALGFSVTATTLASTSNTLISSETRGVGGALNYSNVVPNSVFPTIISGTNTFAVTGITGTGSIKLTYKNAWI